MSELSQKDIRKLEKSFLAINAKRLMRCHDVLPRTHQDFISLVPLMFHLNDPKIPGYIAGDMPVCIRGYFLKKEATDAGRRLIDVNFSISNKMALTMQIQSVFMLEASGTVAAKEDFEKIKIWVCIEPSIDEKGRLLIAEKAKLIEEWAKGKNILVDCCVYDPTNIDKGPIGSKLENKQEVSMLNHQLILDDFYSNSILLAGKYPVWWLIPVENESSYQQSLQAMLDENLIDECDFIDFGSLQVRSEKDFLNAAMWQFYKSLESPYVSILNIILMEIYICRFSGIEFISSIIKKSIHDGVKNIDELDFSLILLEKIESYLTEINDLERLKFIQRCFYVQAKEMRNETTKLRVSEWHSEIISKFVARLAWPTEQFKFLEQRANWTITDIAQERRQLISSLNKSYQVFEAVIEQKNNSKQLVGTLHIVQTKLNNLFGEQNGKIGYFNPYILNLPLEKTQLTLIHSIDKSEQDNLQLYIGSVTPVTAKETTAIYTGNKLIKLIAWGYFNKIITKNTFIHVYSKQELISDKVVRRVIELFDNCFSGVDLAKASTQELMQPAKVEKVVLFVNFNHDSFEQFRVKGQELATEHFDALNFSSKKINIAQHLEIVRFDSRKEAIYECSSEGATGVIKFLITCLSWMLSHATKDDFKLLVYTNDSGRELSVQKRIQEVFYHITHYFFDHPHRDSIRYIIQIDNVSLVFYLKNKVPHFLKVKDIKALESLISMPHHKACSVKFGPGFHKDTYFPVIFDLAKIGKIQLFYVTGFENLDIFIVDERGSLFHQSINNKDINVSRYVQRYVNFLTITIQHIEKLHPETKIDKNISCFQLKRNNDGVVKALKSEFAEIVEEEGFNIKVVVENFDKNKTIIMAHCDGQEFSSARHGNKVFSRVAEYLFSKRSGTNNYPLYITELDATTEILGLKNPSHVQTLHFLKNKVNLEEKLMQ